MLEWNQASGAKFIAQMARIIKGSLEMTRIVVSISAAAANDDFLFIADGKQLYRHSIKMFKITAKAKLEHLVSQIELADPRRVLVFCYQSEILYILTEDLQLVHHIAFKANYSGNVHDNQTFMKTGLCAIAGKWKHWSLSKLAAK